MTAKEFNDALRQWQRSFDPNLGHEIERLGSALSVETPTLPKKKGERSSALVELIGSTDAANRSSLLSAITDFASDSADHLVRPVVEALAALAPDPRVGRLGLAMAEKSRGGKLWRRWVNCIETHGDAALVQAAAAHVEILAREPGQEQTRFNNVLKKLLLKRPASGAFAPIPKRRDPMEMIEAIVARPDDDTPRLIYADWLSEQHDPRGEFIVLQLQPRTEKSQRRERELLRKYGETWAGRLGRVMDSKTLRFSRGFLVGGSATRFIPATWETRLLEELDVRRVGYELGARFDCLLHLSGEVVNVENTREEDAHEQLLLEVAPRLVNWVVPSRRLDRELERIVGRRFSGLTLLWMDDHALRHLERLIVALPLERLRIDTSLAVAGGISLHVSKWPATLQQLELKCDRLNFTLRDRKALGIECSTDQVEEVVAVASRVRDELSALKLESVTVEVMNGPYTNAERAGQAVRKVFRR